MWKQVTPYTINTHLVVTYRLCELSSHSVSQIPVIKKQYHMRKLIIGYKDPNMIR